MVQQQNKRIEQLQTENELLREQQGVDMQLALQLLLYLSI